MYMLGDRLRIARERAGLTQLEAAKRLQINNKTLSRYEHGGSEPNVETLTRLAQLYKVSVDWLAGLSTPSADGRISELYAVFERLSPDDQEYIIGLAKRFKPHK